MVGRNVRCVALRIVEESVEPSCGSLHRWPTTCSAFGSNP